MEEFVGKHWHRFITRRARRGYPRAGVALEEIRKPVATLFRAFGGEGGLKIEAAQADEHGARRGWLQRLAGSQRSVALAWQDAETLRLPPRIDCFPDPALNRQLYHWLAALAAVTGDAEDDWLRDNQRGTQRVLRRFPGLRPLYRRLLAAHLRERPDPAGLPADEAARERAVRQALGEPGSIASLPPGRRPPQPVPLWLHPNPPPAAAAEAPADAADAEPGEGHSNEADQPHNYRAERTEMPEGRDGLLTMRWENIFSWGEYIKVDRPTDEDDDPGAADLARDMQQLHVARDGKTSVSRIRLDLDLPAAAYDDRPLGGAITLPEWDWKRERLVPDHCRLQPMLPRDGRPRPLPEALRPQARRLRHQFAELAQARSWQRAQPDGSELDLQAWLDFRSARRNGEAVAEKGLYRALRVDRRDLATLLLADLSLSTDAAINDQQRIIDVITDGLLLFGEALQASRDRFALYGFSSRRRQAVRFYQLKAFDEAYGDAVRGRIQAIRPGYYTRMGAAIRHASALLAKQANSQRLLLLLSDGKPNDLDHYEGRHGIEDTRRAVREARELGLTPFCITIDREGDAYLPWLFGATGYTVIQRPDQLPQKLLSLYSQLTR